MRYHISEQQRDLTTFGGRLSIAMELRRASSEQLAQHLIQHGFKTSRRNIDQWKKIDDSTWRGSAIQNQKGRWSIKSIGKPLKNSRPPYPGELLLIVQYLRINGFWLFLGFPIPMDRDSDSLPSSAEDLEAAWQVDTNRRDVISTVQALPDDAIEHLISFLKSLGLVD